jgi:hypothetical protein
MMFAVIWDMRGGDAINIKNVKQINPKKAGNILEVED